MALRSHGQALALFIVLALGGLYLMYTVNVFADEGLDTVPELQIELDEALLYGATMTALLMGYATRVFQMRRRQERKQRAAITEARRAGDSDALTGLANRRRFDAALDEMLATSAGVGRDAVMLIDLDRFKAVNDDHGHAAGDAVLVAVAARITGAVREGDLVARIGGDEFAVLAPAVGTVAVARDIADRIAAAIARPIVVADGRYDVGCSIGVRLAPTPGASAGDVLSLADAAMYAAKRDGEAVRLQLA